MFHVDGGAMIYRQKINWHSCTPFRWRGNGLLPVGEGALVYSLQMEG